ncbi:MAG: NgoFVII family restriction endonuclease [Candidatus Neomarinimicrobiota bacterium]
MYKRFLNAAAYIGHLTSPSSVAPKIDSRISEEIFCRSFQAKNLGREDITIDSYKPNDGIGVKTFTGHKQQKIAQFKSAKKYPTPDNPLELIKAISKYRNQRLKKDSRAFNLERMIYHSIYRNKAREIILFEERMNEIDIRKIKIINIKNDKIIKFTDNINYYSFNKSDSQLYMNFNLSFPVDSFKFSLKKADLEYYISHIVKKPKRKQPIDSIALKLFSNRLGEVPQKSGLNQSFADGRARHHNEVYIPIPKAIHNEKPDFFPPRHTTFILTTDDSLRFPAKVCQDNSKALMSNPNKSLGKWILRDQLKLPKGKRATLRYLNQIKINSVLIEKIDKSNFRISTGYNLSHI